jgi:hypothetical protein
MVARKGKINRSKKQKIIYQKGCSRKHLGGNHKCSKKCRIQHGGSCGTEACGLQHGGSFYKTDLPPVPFPLVGNPWTVNTKGAENYFANNLYNKGDPQTMMKLNGGSSKKGSSNKRSYKKRTHKKWGRSRKSGMRGGSLVPQQLTNLGRDLSFSFKSAYNHMNGYSAPVDPKPYMDQFDTKYSKAII